MFPVVAKKRKVGFESRQLTVGEVRGSALDELAVRRRPATVLATQSCYAVHHPFEKHGRGTGLHAPYLAAEIVQILCFREEPHELVVHAVRR